MSCILIVDDSDDVLMVQEMALTRAGHLVHTSVSGEDALKRISSLGKIDLILLDVQMSEMSGPEVLEAIKLRFPETYLSVPVVFVTGNATPPDMLCAGWIHKTIGLAEFVASVGRFLSPDLPPKGLRHA